MTMNVAAPARTSVAALVLCGMPVLLAVLPEVDGPLLDEGVAAFHRLVRLVVEVERGGGELGHARARLGVDVERLLGQGERGRALLQELAAPLLDLGAQILQRDHLVDEAQRERLLRAVLAAEIPDLARLLL